MKPRVRRWLGIGLGAMLGAGLIVVLAVPGWEELHAPGPFNVGHEQIACTSCHQEAAGTLRQQLQSVARSWIGVEHASVDVGFRKVTSDECTACHDRPDDRHPGYRFLEPRFAVARARLHPETCTGCHREHQGVRVTVAEPTYCRECHEELVLEADPLDVSHRTLVETGRWETCLGCHDYHGNHGLSAPTRLEDAIPVDQIRRYLDGGPSPYPPPILRAVQPEVRTL